MTQISSLLSRAGITQREIAHALGMTPGGVSRKLAGERRITLLEAQQIAAILSHKIGSEVRIEDLLPSRLPNRVAESTPS